MVIAGKDKGKTGKVLKTMAKEDKVLVEGINVATKHQKNRRARSQGQVIEKSVPVHVSNVALVSDKKPVRVGYTVEKDGDKTKKVRIARPSGKKIQRMSKTITVKEKITQVFDTLKDGFGYANVMQAPRITKVVVSTGTGKIDDKAKIALIQDRLARITGQKPSPRPAKQSIASFKLREGDIIGYQVTMRGAQMESFLDKLINIALPQTRDFRGLKTSAIDEMGNMTIGIREHSIFPEAANEELKDVFGLAVTIVTTAKSKEEAEALLRHVGLPLQTEEQTTAQYKNVTV